MAKRVSLFDPLLVAAESGDVDKVRELLQQGKYHVDCTDDWWTRRTPMHYACEKGHLTVVRVLLSEFKADVNCNDYSRRTPLHYACEKGHLAVVRVLLSEFKADVNCTDYSGETPLHYACEKGHLAVVRVLLSEFKDDVNCTDNRGVTPLHYACGRGHLDVVRVLLSEFKADVNCNDNRGVTPLHYACEKEHLAVVRVLLSEFKADLTIQDEDGLTALMLTARGGHDDLALALLRDYHCPVTGRDRGGWGVLHHACAGGGVRLVRILICEHNSDANVHNKDGNTPLHVAAGAGKFKVALLLINEFGCDPNELGFLNRTLLHMASKSGCNSLVQTLLKSMSPMLTDDHGDTPLHFAASYRDSLDCVKSLVHANAPLFARNSSGERPIDVAYAYGKSKTFLIEYVKENRTKIQYSYDIVFKHAKNRYSGSHSISRVFVLGNPGAGKSSFVASLKREGFFESFSKVSESSVPPHTAGIIPSVHTSKEYGRVLFYDFAGDAEYYSSHAAIFEGLAASRKGDNMFIVVVDLMKDDITIETTLHYWFSFLQYQKFSKPWLIVVGSHFDLTTKESDKGKLLDQFCVAVDSCVRNVKHFCWTVVTHAPTRLLSLRSRFQHGSVSLTSMRFQVRPACYWGCWRRISVQSQPVLSRH